MKRDHSEGLSEYWSIILFNIITFKMVVKEQGWEWWNRAHMAQNRGQCWVLVNTVIKLLVPNNKLTSPHNYVLYERSLLHRVTNKIPINPLTPELNPSKQCCLLRFFTGDF